MPDRQRSLFRLQQNHPVRLKIRNLTTNGSFVDAKSIIMVLTLGVMKDHEVVIQVDGPDEETALASLRSLIDGNFGEG